jgi:hypothetical protein
MARHSAQQQAILVQTGEHYLSAMISLQGVVLNTCSRSSQDYKHAVKVGHYKAACSAAIPWCKLVNT